MAELRRLWTRVLLVLLFVVAVFVGLDNMERPLANPDEGRYSEISREMAVSGDWVTPRLNGIRYFEKPPLQYWATAAAFLAFGQNEPAARVYTLLAGLLTVLLVGYTGWRLAGAPLGLASMVMLASSPYFLTMGGVVTLDMLRAYDRAIVEALRASREVSTYIPALAYSFAMNPTEIEVEHEERQAGESKYSLYQLIRLNFDLVTGFSVVPLQVFSLFGIFVSLMSLLVYVAVIVQRVVTGEAHSLWVIWDRDILQFFLTGVMLFGLGLIGEYVGRIYQQVRERPRYLIQAILEQRGD